MKQNYLMGQRPSTRRLVMIWVLLLAGLVCPAVLRAQSYTLPAVGTATITTCAGTLYDNGGPNGTYSTYANGSVTVMPGTAGSKVRLQFNTIAIEPYYDHLYVYDGPNTSAPLIGSYDSYNQPGTLYGTTASGALTVRLTSDGITQFDGFAAAISCVAVVPPQAQPDLVVQKAQLSFSSTVAAGNISAVSALYNQSGATASSSNLGYYLSADAVLDASDVLVSNSYGYALAVGQYSNRYDNLLVPMGTAPGSYYVLFVADPTNVVAESNETNNVSAVSLTVLPPGIDLTIQQASVSPTNPAPGTPLSLSCYISNQGNSNAPSSSVGYYLSTDATLDAADQLLTSQYGGPLVPTYPTQRYGTAAVPGNLLPGTYFILFVADYQSQVAETDEANNVAAVSFTVSPPGIDLVIQQEQLFPASTVPGNTVQASCTVLNQGNVTAGSSTAGFYLSTNPTFDASDVLLSTSIGYALGAYQTSTRYANPVIPASTPAGSYYMLFVADPANVVAETNETNNVRSLPLTLVAPTYDLTNTNAYLSPNAVTAGSSTQASSYLDNQGNALVPAATLGYYLSADQSLDASDVLLASNSGAVSGMSYASRSVSLTIPVGTAVGSYYILFVADHLNQVVETNEANNVAAVALQVVAPVVDLIIPQPYLSPSVGAPNGIINTNCYIENQGNSAAASSNVGYYLSTNATFDASDVLLLHVPGGYLTAGNALARSNSLTIPAGTALGSYYVLFVADPTNVVAESNEANNVSSYPLQVVAPAVDLLALQGYVSPGVSAAGNTINASCYIQNLGNSPAASSNVGYYLSTNTTFDADDVLLLHVPGASLMASSSMAHSNNLLIPANTPAGSYYVLFVADPTNVVAESNESNNVISTSLLLLATGVDLIPQQPYLYTSSATPGVGIQVACTILNGGTATAASSALGFYLSTDQTLDATDVLLATEAGTALPSAFASQRTSTLVVPRGTAAGSYYVLFVADPANAVAETNETNNVISLVLAVDPPFCGNVVPMNGVATVVSCSTSIYDNGGLGYYSNNSSGSLTLLPATAGALVQLAFTTLDVEDGYDFVSVYDGTNASAPLLGTFSGTYVGAQLPLPLTATNAAGALTVVFSSDAFGAAAGFAATVSCVSAPLSDLLLTQIGASPSTIAAGTNVTLTSTIANQGGGPANASAVGFYLSADQTLSASDVLLGISPGGLLDLNETASRLLTAPVPASTVPGNYFVLCVADPANAVAEANETNNLAALRLTVMRATATRDETVGYTIALAPNPVASGQPLLLRLDGSGPSGPATVVLYNALGQRVQSQSVLLGSGRINRTEVPTQGLASGVYTLRLTGSGLSATHRVLIN